MGYKVVGLRARESETENVSFYITNLLDGGGFHCTYTHTSAVEMYAASFKKSGIARTSVSLMSSRRRSGILSFVDVRQRILIYLYTYIQRILLLLINAYYVVWILPRPHLLCTIIGKTLDRSSEWAREGKMTPPPYGNLLRVTPSFDF